MAKEKRNLHDYLLALALYGLVNVFIFHSGLYGTVCRMDSYAGNILARMRVLEELEESPSGKPIALIGDSTVEEGIGAAELAGQLQKPVANLAMPGTGPLEWLHFLRSIDPHRNRFDTVVITIVPQVIGSYSNEEGIQTLTAVANVGEMIRYVSIHPEGRGKAMECYAAIDRIYAFRHDLRDLFLSPARWSAIPWQRREFLEKIRHWPGETYDVCRVQIDPDRGTVTDWGEVSDPLVQRLALNALNRTEKLNRRPRVSGILEPMKEIIQHYSNSHTTIVIATIPFSVKHNLKRRAAPVRRYFDFMKSREEAGQMRHYDAVDEPLFRDCRNFYDFRHLNARGRKLFTARLGDFLGAL